MKMKLNVGIKWFQTADSGFAILKHCMSILAVLSQSLLLCWLGERHIQQVCVASVSHMDVRARPDPRHSVTNLMMFCVVQSLRVNAAAYDCSWYAQSHRYKRLLHMVIKRAQDPVKFCAGSFYDINIEKFDHVSFQMVCRRRGKLLNSSLFCMQMYFISELLNLMCFQFSAKGHLIFRSKC